MATERARKTQIFDEVYFAIIPSDTFPHEEVEKISQDLLTRGGTRLELDSQQLYQITHIISTHTDFPAYHDATEGFIHVVKPAWVDASIQKGKASNTRQFSPDPHYIFNDVVLCCADDLPDGDKEAIVGGVHAMGGQYSPNVTKLCTHLVALTKDAIQAVTAFERNQRCMVVLPHWFDTCLKLGKKIDAGPYIIPKEGLPLYRTEQTTDPVKHIEPKIDLSQPSSTPFTPPASPPGSPSNHRQALSVLRNKRILLHHDLNISEHLLRSIREVIVQGGGQVVHELSEANMLICNYRGTTEFVAASRAGKDVGNINWLYKLISQNRWTDPTSRLLHYPYPKGGISGFENFSVSVSNYQGDARMWIESLVAAMGGTFNKNMSQETSILITAHMESDKCDAAREWEIDMVNHLWLEESYARCEIQPLTRPRYTIWPERTNLGEVVGQTHIDRQGIVNYYLPKRAEVEQADGGMDVDDEEEEEENDEGNAVDVEVEVDPEVHTSTKKTPKTSSAKRKREVQTPLQRLQLKDATPSSRGAKDRALSKLHDMAPDIAQFEKESKRVGGVIYGGRRVTDPERIAVTTDRSRKRSISEACTTPEVDADADDEKATKKPKISKPKAYRIAISGIPEAETYTTKLKGLNIKIIEDTRTQKIDVLVLARLTRTKKILCALPRAPMIVSKDWLDAMAKKKTQLPPEDYKFKDPEAERETNITLKQCQINARKNISKGGMLKGWTVLSTPNTKGGVDTIREVVLANGGNFLLFNGSKAKLPTPTSDSNVIDLAGDDSDVNMSDGADEDNDDRDTQKPLLYMVSVEADHAHWKKFREMAEDKGWTPRIAKSDWLWRIAMSQDATEWDEKWKW